MGMLVSCSPSSSVTFMHLLSFSLINIVSYIFREISRPWVSTGLYPQFFVITFPDLMQIHSIDIKSFNGETPTNFRITFETNESSTSTCTTTFMCLPKSVAAGYIYVTSFSSISY